MNNIIEFIDKISWEIFSISLDILGMISGILLILCCFVAFCMLLFCPFIPIIAFYKSKKYYVIKSHRINLSFTTIIKAKNKKQAQIKYYSDSCRKFDIIESIEELEDE